jgi:hypothetical protein
MDIFKGLFRNFFRSNQPGRNYEDKTPYKIQVIRKALTGMNVECAGGVYRLLVPKRLYNKSCNYCPLIKHFCGGIECYCIAKKVY